MPAPSHPSTENPAETFRRHLGKLLRGEAVLDQTLALQALFERTPLSRLPALLRVTRAVLGSWEWVGSRSLADAADSLRSLSEGVPVSLRDVAWFAVLADRSGFRRQVAVAQLSRLPGALAVCGLYFAADDHVPAVRELAGTALASRSDAELATAPFPATTPPPDAHRAAWRESIRRRLDRPAAQAELRRVAVSDPGLDGWAALELLPAESWDLAALAGAENWRVRQAIVRRAAAAGDLAVLERLQADVQVAVRHAVALAGATLPPLSRSAIMRRAFADRTRRVRRAAAWFLRDDSEVVEAAQWALVDGHSSRGQAQALENLVFLLGQDARPEVEAALRSGGTPLQREAIRCLFELRCLAASHLARLEGDTDPSVLLLACRLGARTGRIAPQAILRLAGHPYLVGRDRLTALLAVSAWDALPTVLQAAAERWPGAEAHVEEHRARYADDRVQGWLRPSPAQRAGIQAALDTYGEEAPDWAAGLFAWARSAVLVP